MTASLHRQVVWIHPHHLFEPLRDRGLDIFNRKLDRCSRRMKALSSDRLLFRRKVSASFTHVDPPARRHWLLSRNTLHPLRPAPIRVKRAPALVPRTAPPDAL